MTIPKIVAFDLGKVLVDFDYSIAAREIAARGKITAEALARTMATSPALIEFETGLLTNEQFFQQVREVTGFAGDLEEFAELFGNIFTPIQPMLDLHATLRRQRIPTYIFSNTNDLSVRHIRRHFPFFAEFDGYVLSYEHGAMKPDARLYEVVEKVTGRLGEDILYVDDRLENVEAGAARGWQVLLQETPEKTRAAMVKLGLPLG